LAASSSESMLRAASARSRRGARSALLSATVPPFAFPE
jgi:hypothetical protein